MAKVKKDADIPQPPKLMFKRPRGRPTGYTKELGKTICAHIMEGKTLRVIEAIVGMPTKSMMLSWLPKFQVFQDQYRAAVDIRADLYGSEEIIEIADDGSNDFMEVHHGDSVSWKTNGEAIARSRLRVETRKWLATKLLPKKYGDKATLIRELPNTSALSLEEIDALLGLMAKISPPRQG